MIEACYMCNNARIDDDLTYNTDLSYISVGDCIDGFRMMVRSGANKPVGIIFEEHTAAYGWITIGEYNPKYCPDCGRKIIEYKENLESN